MVARPSDGKAVALRTTTAVVWSLLADCQALAELEERLGELYPAVPADARHDRLVEILDRLIEEGLIERPGA